MRDTRKRIVEDACTAWEVGNSAAALVNFADDIVFSVHAPERAGSVVGSGQGKAELARRLGGYLENIQVRYYEVLRIMVRMDGTLRSSVRFIYRHRREPFEIEGTMSHVWRFAGDKVVRLEIFYDALRMRAFYDLVADTSERRS